MKNKNYLWSGEDGNNIHQDLMDFMAGNDIKLDRHLFVFDIEATKVHVQGLKKLEFSLLMNTEKLKKP